MVNYTQSGSLNDRAYDLPDQNWHPVGPSFVVNKLRAGTPLELEFAGTCLAATLAVGFGIKFEIRVNNLAPNFKNQGSLRKNDLEEPVEAKSVYTQLAPGTYKAQMYCQVPNVGATAKGIVLDPGGWGAVILATEF
jgi:hypothetical protein